MDIFPELRTAHLHLRRMQVEDIDALLRYVNNRNITDYILNFPYPYREPDAVFRISYVVQGFKQKSRFVFAITQKGVGELIGEISLHLQGNQTAEVGYWVGEPFWNQGIASEAIEAVLAFGFERLGLKAIFATCHEENTASCRASTKNGLQAYKTQGNVITYVKYSGADAPAT